MTRKDLAQTVLQARQVYCTVKWCRHQHITVYRTTAGQALRRQCKQHRANAASIPLMYSTVSSPAIKPVHFNVLPLQELKAKDVALTPLDHSGDGNPVDVIWGAERPSFPQSPVRVHPLHYAGESVQQKLEKVKSGRTFNVHSACFRGSVLETGSVVS